MKQAYEPCIVECIEYMVLVRITGYDHPQELQVFVPAHEDFAMATKTISGLFGIENIVGVTMANVNDA